jgi:hypothetical protein
VNQNLYFALTVDIMSAVVKIGKLYEEGTGNCLV